MQQTAVGVPLTRTLWRSLAIVAAVTIVTAWFSDLFYFPDEHYQILEFMSYRLGITAASDLPWEFTARIRPWTQPFLYTLIAKPLMLAGAKDLFVVTFVLRLATGVLSLAALAMLAQSVLATLESEEEKLSFARYLPFFGFLPYLFVRTSSESFSATFITMAVALVMRARSPGILGCAGLLCGLAFESRYQSGILVVGLAAWLIWIARVRVVALAMFATGFAAAMMIGAIADRWGYGAWIFPPWGYFKVNILDGVAAKTFGTEPFFAYLYLMPAQFFFAITLILMAAMVAMWLRNPRHVVTWVTLPFVLLHMVIAHKEARFLFPIAILTTAFPVLGFSSLLPRWRDVFTRIWHWRHSAAAKVVTMMSVISMAYLAIYPFGVRPHMPMAKYLYRHFPGTVYSFDTAFQSYPMYRPAVFRSETLADVRELDGLLNQGPVYLLSNTPTLPAGVPASVRVTMLYSEFPLAALGYGASGTRFIHVYTDFAAHHRWLGLLPLYWMTLYRVERPAITRP